MIFAPVDVMLFDSTFIKSQVRVIGSLGKRSIFDLLKDKSESNVYSSLFRLFLSYYCSKIYDFMCLISMDKISSLLCLLCTFSA